MVDAIYCDPPFIFMLEDGSIYPMIKQCLNVIDFFIGKFYLSTLSRGSPDPE
jgi:hypothetical protein